MNDLWGLCERHLSIVPLWLCYGRSHCYVDEHTMEGLCWCFTPIYIYVCLFFHHMWGESCLECGLWLCCASKCGLESEYFHFSVSPGCSLITTPQGADVHAPQKRPNDECIIYVSWVFFVHTLCDCVLLETEGGSAYQSAQPIRL